MKNVFYLTVFALILVGCSENPLKIYKGNWGGTYSGAKDFGQIEFYVDKEGSLNGQVRSDTLMTGQKPMIGTVDAVGGLIFTAQLAGQTYEFSGDLDKNRGSGKWVALADSSLFGTWRASKF